MARGTYIIPCSDVSVANQAVTLIFVNPGVDATLSIVRCYISQAANATSAQQRVQFVTQPTAFPTLTTIEPEKTSFLDGVSTIVGGTAGAAGTCGINASAEGAGGKSILQPDAFNVLNGYLWVATPAEVYEMNASIAEGFGLHFPAAPTTLTNWNAGLVYTEL